MIASAKFEGRFKEIRDEIIKKTLFKSIASDICPLEYKFIIESIWAFERANFVLDIFCFFFIF